MTDLAILYCCLHPAAGCQTHFPANESTITPSDGPRACSLYREKLVFLMISFFSDDCIIMQTEETVLFDGYHLQDVAVKQREAFTHLSQSMPNRFLKPASV